jgi:hypothetical protein
VCTASLMADRAKIVWADFHSRLWHSSELNRTDRFGALFSRHKKLSSRLEAIYLQPRSNLAWCNSCNTPRWWRVSNDESRRVVSEGEGACSPLFRVRSHLPLRGKQGWMTPRVGVKTTLTNGSAPLGALVPKQGPHFLPGRSLRKAVVWADESAGSRRVDPISSCPSRRALRLDLRNSVVQPTAPLPKRKLAALVHLFGRRNIQLVQYVYNFGVSQSRSIVLKG